MKRNFVKVIQSLSFLPALFLMSRSLSHARRSPHVAQVVVNNEFWNGVDVCLEHYVPEHPFLVPLLVSSVARFHFHESLVGEKKAEVGYCDVACTVGVHARAQVVLRLVFM